MKMHLLSCSDHADFFWYSIQTKTVTCSNHWAMPFSSETIYPGSHQVAAAEKKESGAKLEAYTFIFSKLDLFFFT